MTTSGFELAFGTNHVGTFYFTELLLDRSWPAAPAGSSMSPAPALPPKGIDWDAVRRTTVTRTGFDEYCVSKLANVLHAQELGRQLAGTGVTTYSLHPGVDRVGRVARGAVRAPPGDEAVHEVDRAGRRTSLYCATSPDVADQTGLYYDNQTREEAVEGGHARAGRGALGAQ